MKASFTDSKKILITPETKEEGFLLAAMWDRYDSHLDGRKRTKDDVETVVFTAFAGKDDLCNLEVELVNGFDEFRLHAKHAKPAKAITIEDIAE